MIKKKKIIKYIGIFLVIFYLLSCSNSKNKCNNIILNIDIGSYVDCLNKTIEFDFMINNKMYLAKRDVKQNVFQLCTEDSEINDRWEIINDLMFNSFTVESTYCNEVVNCQFIIGLESNDETLVLKLIDKNTLDTKPQLENLNMDDIFKLHDTLFEEVWK